MTTKKIATGEILALAWRCFKQHWGTLLGAIAIMFVLQFVLGFLGESLVDEDGQFLESFAVSIFTLFVGMIIQVGLIQIVLNLVNDRPVEIGQIVGDYRVAFQYLLSSIVYGLIVFVGILLLIVPGIVWAIKYGQWPYLLVDKKMGVFESLRESEKITSGSKADIFVLYLALAGILILSIIPLGLGLIISIPVSMLAYAYVYKKLAYSDSNLVQTEQTQQGTDVEILQEKPTEMN